MPILTEEFDEANLWKRLEQQKVLVERLVAEGKDATSANAILYELSKAFSELRPRASKPVPNTR